MKFVRTSIVLACLALTVAIGGCDADAGGSAVTTGSEGAATQLSENGKLPDDYPGDVPIYDGKIVRTFTSNENVTVAVETSDDVADVYEWCLKEVEDEGWDITAKYKTTDGGTIAADKGDRIVQYTMTARDKGSALVVFTGPKAE